VIQDNETADQMASDLEQVDLNCLGTEAMFTSYDELNKGNDIDKEGTLHIVLHYCHRSCPTRLRFEKNVTSCLS
jgi:hypothetical protein